MCPTKKTIFLMVAIALALSIAHTVEAAEELDMEEETGEEEATIVDLYLNSLRGVSSFLPQHKVTCKTDPAICKVKGSPGPYCCKKVCVNLETDHRNCGACKNKCKNTQMCCSGSCVPSYTGCGALPA